MHKDISFEELEIIKRFKENVYGKTPNLELYNCRHDGRAGHWLETQMGIVANANNDADLLGFEMKNTTTSKTTFGDWSADYYIFSDDSYNITRDEFIQIFGKPNDNKNGRCSWSGTPIPSINRRSAYNGSRMIIDQNCNIFIIYDFSQDSRDNKSQLIPHNLQKENLYLARWSKQNLETKLHNKFGQKGWFKCIQDAQQKYVQIAFGEPMNFESWIELVRQGIVFFDSGMYIGNPRNYSQWRSNNNYWDSLIKRRYPPFPDGI